MHPLIHIGEHTISAYRLSTVAAIMIGLVLAAIVARRREASTRGPFVVYLSAVVGGLVAARSFELITTGSGSSDRLFDLRAGNMAIYGGLAGAVAVGAIAARLLGEPIARLADDAVPALAAGFVVLRIGCYLTGCCFGTETDLGVGVTYPAGSLPALAQLDGTGWSLLAPIHPVHPIPLYEIAALTVLGVLAVIALGRRTVDGAVAAGFMGGYSLVRLVIHPVRDMSGTGLDAMAAAVLYAAVATAALTWWRHQLRIFLSERVALDL